MYPNFELDILLFYFFTFFIALIFNYLIFLAYIYLSKSFYAIYNVFSVILIIWMFIYQKNPQSNFFMSYSLFSSFIVVIFFLASYRGDYFNKEMIIFISKILKENFKIVYYSVFYLIFLLILNYYFYQIFMSIELISTYKTIYSGYWYIYLFISYHWIMNTLAYLYYLNCSIFFSSWFFLSNSQFYSSISIESHIKKTLTKSFGDATLAAFILPFKEKVVFFEPKKEAIMDPQALCIIYCCCVPMNQCADGFSPLLHRSGLFYSSTYSIPVEEGSKRWMEHCYKKQIHMVDHFQTFDLWIKTNYWTSIGNISLIIGFIYRFFFPKNTYNSFILIFSIINSMVQYKIFEKVLFALYDCLILGVAENRTRMKQISKDLYKTIKKFYIKNLEDELLKIKLRNY